MDRRQSTDGRIYEEFDPIARSSAEPGFDTLTIYVPGFRKEQLKVQVTSNRKVRVMGERRTEGNKWIRFRKEFPVQSNTDIDAISAKFDASNLVVKLPRSQKRNTVLDEPQSIGRQQPRAAEKAQEASRGAERVSGHKPTMEKLDQKKEGSSYRGANEVHMPKPTMERPAAGKREEEEKASGEHLLKPESEKEGKEREDSRGSKKEDMRGGIERSPCEVKTYKEIVGGFLREIKNNPRVMTNGVVVAAAMVVLAVGIYTGTRLRCTFGDLHHG